MTYEELRKLELQLIRERIDPGIAEAILSKIPTPTNEPDHLRGREIPRSASVLTRSQGRAR